MHSSRHSIRGGLNPQHMNMTKKLSIPLHPGLRVTLIRCFDCGLRADWFLWLFFRMWPFDYLLILHFTPLFVQQQGFYVLVDTKVIALLSLSVVAIFCWQKANPAYSYY